MTSTDDPTPRTSPTASALASVAARHGLRSMREGVSLLRLWFACFVAQGAYALLTGLLVSATALVAMQAASGPDASIVDWVIDAVRDGDLSTSTLWWTLLVLVGIGLLGLLGCFVVPLFIQVLVRLTCHARVSYAWAFVANLASWIVVTALSTLLWVIPGAQPFAAFFVWLGSSALCGLLVRARLMPLTNASASERAASQVPDGQPADTTRHPHVRQESP